MPTMTNPETGETKEISMEEFLKMMRSGNGSIQQVVTHADGSTSSTTIFGNISSDGLDRSVNIFVDSDTFNAFITRKLKKMTGQMPDPESEKAPLELFEMTIDFTHAAIMGIVRKTKEELSVKLYTRNEQKATFDYLLQSSKTWKVNEDGSITFNVADLQGEDKTISLYMLSFLEMRQFLRASGKLAELKELGNRGTGVIIKATGQADDATATIVRGLNRPNLPCEMFLLGEQMMRPYPDELFSDAMASTMSLDERIKAAENGDPDMMELLAQQYLNGDEVEQDFVKSAYWWKKLAETGNAVGQFNIGLHYAKGCGVTRDFQKAAEWMRLSAENGDEDAPDAAANYSQAYDNLQKAEAGDAAAQAAIAKLYMQIGGSLEQYGHQNDYAESFKWAQKAAAQGNLDGMYCLALCYEHGRGTTVSKVKAADTYKKAAERGHAPSQWNLAVCYMNGYGYDRNEVTGYMWAYRAADQEYDLAVDGLRYQDKLLEQLIEHYEDPEAVETLEGTQYEGRAARCESLKAGTTLTPKITKDNSNAEAIELFYNDGSVGLLSRWNSAPLLALLKLERIDLKVTVKSCIPKSKRGARARNAEVKLTLSITEHEPETPEEQAPQSVNTVPESPTVNPKRKLSQRELLLLDWEEEKKHLDEDDRYQEELKIWECECERIKEERKKEVDLRIDGIKNDLKEEAQKKYHETLRKSQQALKDLEFSKASAESTLAALGFFRFAEKNEQKALIKEISLKIENEKLSIGKAKNTLDSEMSSVQKNAWNQRSLVEQQVSENIPFPPKPPIPDYRNDPCEREKRSNAYQFYQGKDGKHARQMYVAANIPKTGDLEQDIYNCIRVVKIVHLDDLREFFYCTPQASRPQLTKLIQKRLVNRKEFSGTPYFMLSNYFDE